MNFGGYCFFCFLFLVLVFRLPLKLQGLEAGRRLQELVDQWSDSVWQVLCSYNKGEITAHHFVCTHIQGHMHSLFQGVWILINKKVFKTDKVLYPIQESMENRTAVKRVIINKQRLMWYIMWNACHLIGWYLYHPSPTFTYAKEANGKMLTK